MGYSIGVLNSIRTDASQDYQNRIPVATQENITAIGNALQTYTVLKNEFCTALVNKIGKTKIEQKLFSNKLSRFKQGSILTGQDVEEIFIAMSKSEGAYDPAGPNPLGRRNPPDVNVIYHRLNRQDKYVISIGDLDFIRVFRSEATLDTFITGLINSVYSGAEYDEWLAMKNLIATYDGYATTEVTLTDGNLDTTQFLITMRKLAMDLSFASTKYNKAGVLTWSDPSQLVCLINKDVLAEVDVRELSKAFNLGKTDIQIEVIPMDDFGSLEDTLAVVVDKDWFRVYDTLSHMEPIRNPDGLFTNYFYHVHQILSASTFKNAVRVTC